MPHLDTLVLNGCMSCGKDKSFLRVTETTFMLNGKPSHNPIVVCADCGAIMVRVGGMGCGYGWACHVPESPQLAME